MIEKQYFLDRLKETGLLLNQRITREQGEALYNFCHRFSHESFDKTMTDMVENGGWLTSNVLLPKLRKYEPAPIDNTPKDDYIRYYGDCKEHKCEECEVDICGEINNFMWPLLKRLLNKEMTYDEYKAKVNEKFPIIFRETNEVR